MKIQSWDLDLQVFVPVVLISECSSDGVGKNETREVRRFLQEPAATPALHGTL